jgi:hypothetical protein
VAQGINQVSNQGTSLIDTNGDGIFVNETSPASVADTNIARWNRFSPQQLPATRFAQGTITSLPSQPEAAQYQDYPDLLIEIPALGGRIPIVGVAYIDGSWTIDWLGNQAGYLIGTALPTQVGNSVLTTHNHLPSGLPGPFFGLSTMKWGGLNPHPWLWGKIHLPGSLPGVGEACGCLAGPGS